MYLNNKILHGTFVLNNKLIRIIKFVKNNISFVRNVHVI